jgi:L-amino acid N-acyltransferase YncA
MLPAAARVSSICGIRASLSIRYFYMTIVPLLYAHWPAVRAIYQDNLPIGEALPGPEAPTWETWDQTHLTHSRLVVEADTGEVVGWAALRPLSERGVESDTAILRLYLTPHARYQGVGTFLLQTLLAESKKHGISIVRTEVGEENLADIEWYVLIGFRTAGYQERSEHFQGPRHNMAQLEWHSPTAGPAL